MKFSEFFESLGVPAFGTKVCEPVNCGAGLAIEDGISGGDDDSYMVVIGDVTPDVRCAKKSTTKGNWCEDDVTECCADYEIRWACLCNCDVDWCDDIDDVEILSASKLMNDTGRVPAYGTWSMKYNASLSSPKSKVKLTDKLPKYATK